ncbi:DUF2017 family protein, partial [Mycobacterium tuberculosis]
LSRAASCGANDDRDSSSPSDELDELTGIKTGHAQRPGDPTLRRLLPDFYRPDDLDDDDPTAVDGSESFNAALLKNLAGAMIGLLDDRDSSSPS